MTSGSTAEIGFVVAVTIFSIGIWAAMVGSILPIVLHRLRVDPAVVSAPFISGLVDTTGLMIYFAVAQPFLVFHRASVAAADAGAKTRPAEYDDRMSMVLPAGAPPLSMSTPRPPIPPLPLLRRNASPTFSPGPPRRLWTQRAGRSPERGRPPTDSAGPDCLHAAAAR